MNSEYINQVTRAITLSPSNKGAAALQWMIFKLGAELNKCLNVDNGSCSTEWKHEECATLMRILYDLSGEDRYKSLYPIDIE